jgi:hypothetical protein
MARALPFLTAGVSFAFLAYIFRNGKLHVRRYEIVSLDCRLNSDATVHFGLTFEVADKTWMATGPDWQKVFNTQSGVLFDFIPTTTYFYPRGSNNQTGSVSGLDVSTVRKGDSSVGYSFDTGSDFTWIAM